VIPTNAGEVCVFAGVPASAGAIRGSLHQTYHRLLAAATATTGAGAGLGGRLAEGRPPHRLRTWVGRPSFIRQAHGAGWALVGDAASFLDPLSTYGITNALRDAHMLASSVAVDDIDTALCRYGEERDVLVGSLLDVVDQIAGYGWDVARVPGLLRQLSAVMSDELERISAPGRTQMTRQRHGPSGEVSRTSVASAT
jgi:flavin-dependent dehydrogenase